MAKKMTYIAQVRMKLIMSVFSLAAAITSLGYVTYAWFQAQKSQNLELMSVAIEEGLTYSLKYFLGNGEEGYPSPSLSSVDQNVTVTNYGTNFQPVATNFHEMGIPMKQPSYRLTYALEVYSQEVSYNQNIEITLASFNAPGSSINYDNATDEAITLATAIDIYTTVIDGGLTNAEITTLASAFVEADIPSSDRFDGTEGAKSLASSPLLANSGEQSRIFLITLEFSGHPSTFYDFDHDEGVLSFFNLSTNGNSNVYQDLSFTMNNIVISKSPTD
ncbi:MAG: hypothetical protein WCR77_05150 [Bacilli bacterium]|jgi:hypothetical protein